MDPPHAAPAAGEDRDVARTDLRWIWSGLSGDREPARRHVRERQGDRVRRQLAAPLLVEPVQAEPGGVHHVAGAGMMWGPGVARAAADVALTGTSDVVDVTRLGLDRFDERGRSKLAADPVALPFPDAAPGRLTVS